jgi:hypothetical protein
MNNIEEKLLLYCRCLEYIYDLKIFNIYTLKLQYFFPVHETNFLTFFLDNLCRQRLYSLKIYFSFLKICFIFISLDIGFV